MEADSASEPPGSLPFESARIAGRRSVLDLWADDDDDSRQAGQATREGTTHGVGRKGGDDVRPLSVAAMLSGLRGRAGADKRDGRAALESTEKHGRSKFR